MSQTRDIRLVKTESTNPDPQPYYSESWALVIGIDRYRDPSARLANARHDAEEIADVLGKLYGFEHVFTLYDEEASKDAILEWLRDKLPAQLKSGDRLVIFFAGHGTSREGSSGQKRGYLIPFDAEFGQYSDYVDMTELRDACGFIPAKHILVILDCCFSGIAAVTARATTTPPPLDKLTESYVRRITERSAWQVLTAGALDELVADSGSRPGHSAFTSALLTGLYGKADQNQDGVITASDLAAFIKPEVSKETTASGGKGQIPFFSYFAGSDQGDFVLIKSGDTPEFAPPTLREMVPEGTRPYLIWGTLVAVIVILAIIGGFAWFQTKVANDRFTALVGTVTQEAIGFATRQQATLDAVTAAPEPTRTAVVATQTAEVVATRTAMHPYLTAISVDSLSVFELATSTPTPTATARLILTRVVSPADQFLEPSDKIINPNVYLPTPTPTLRRLVPQQQIEPSQQLIQP